MVRFQSTYTVHTSSVEETKNLAGQLARSLKKGDVVLFSGNLGAGKTTFVQGVVHALGAKEAAVSPTFVLIETINGRIPVHHMDFYRLTPREILDIGVQDYFSGSGEIEAGALLIEWAERCKNIWPKDRLNIRIAIGRGKTNRRFHFVGRGSRSAALVSKLKKIS